MAFQIGGMSLFETEYANSVVGGLAGQEQQYMQQLGLSGQLLGNNTVASNGAIVPNGTPTGFGFAGNDNSAGMTGYFLGQMMGANAGYLAANNSTFGTGTVSPFLFAFGATGAQGQGQYTPIFNRCCFCCCDDDASAASGGTATGGTGTSQPPVAGNTGGGIIITSGGPGSGDSGSTGSTGSTGTTGGTTPTGQDDDDCGCRHAHHRLHHGHNPHQPHHVRHPHHPRHHHPRPGQDNDDNTTGTTTGSGTTTGTTTTPPIWDGCTCELPPISIFQWTTSTPPVNLQPLQMNVFNFGGTQMYPAISPQFM